MVFPFSETNSFQCKIAQSITRQAQAEEQAGESRATRKGKLTPRGKISARNCPSIATDTLSLSP